MVRLQRLRRTLRGAGGVRLYDIPGVIYPPEMLEEPSKTPPGQDKLQTQAPPWGVSTQEAAQMLGLSLSGTRSLLQRKRVRYMAVGTQLQNARLYWHREEVARLCTRAMPRVHSRPEHTYSAAEVCQVLQIGRSSLYRYVRRYKLKEIRVKLLTQGHLRRKYFYLQSEIRQLAARIRAAKSHMVEASHLMRETEKN